MPDDSLLRELLAAGGAKKTLSPAQILELGTRTGKPGRELEAEALDSGLVPERYARNLPRFGPSGQARLLRSRAAVIGAGGLGGYVIELLARAGVGELVVVDGDRFTADNLNRQLLGTGDNLGGLKAEAARERVTRVNPGISVLARPVFLDPDNAPKLLAGCAVAVDALDSIRARLVLEDAADSLGIPVVHGSLGGCQAQVSVSVKGARTLRGLYGDGREDRGAETFLGTPTPVPALVASLQALETIRLLLGEASPLAGKLLLADLETFRFSLLDLGKSGA